MVTNIRTFMNYFVKGTVYENNKRLEINPEHIIMNTDGRQSRIIKFD